MRMRQRVDPPDPWDLRTRQGGLWGVFIQGWTQSTFTAS